MDNFNKGFIQIPHKIGNILPLIKLTARETRVVWLILRLTYGCQRRWAKLKFADLQTVGIFPSSAGKVIKSLLGKRIINQNGKTKEYRLHEEYLSSEITQRVSPELEKLRNLVGRQLKKQNYQSGNQEVAKSVTEALPKEEDLGYQNSNSEGLPISEVLYTKEDGFLTPKDILNKKINKSIDKEFIGSTTSKEGSEYKTKVDPNSWVGNNETEYEAKRAWEVLEPDKPASFDFYVWAYKQDLPASKFREFADEIRNNRKIKNKGAAFVKKVKEYLEERR